MERGCQPLQDLRRRHHQVVVPPRVASASAAVGPRRCTAPARWRAPGLV